ncbi:hypothetical protein C8R45DRAFT_1223724 [Mycena sanguinolenta]|nr:hypothetical protein C8R45DRAFT_1223724 [Mycena sanguinolenta]
MHASLSESNFSRLPQSLRIRAIAAVSGSDALDETMALMSDLDEMEPQYRSLTIPVFCTPLNPANIPTLLARFDVSGWTSIRFEILHAHLCLRGIWELGDHNAIVRGAFVAIWQRVWPWIEFLDEYGDSFSQSDENFRKTRYSVFLSMRFLHGNKEAAKLIESTPGLYVVVWRAWRCFIDVEDVKGMGDVAYFLALETKAGGWSAPTLEDLVIGTGGTRADLASIIISHIALLLPNPDCPVTPSIAFHLAAVIYIGVNQNATSHRAPVLQKFLLSHGAVTAITTAARALCRSPLENAADGLKGLLCILVDQISLRAPTSLPESLRTGLLHLIFTSQHRAAIYPYLVTLLANVLPPATVYHSVLMDLQNYLPPFRDRDASTIFNDPTLVAHLESFVALVGSRLSVMDQYNTGALLAPRACDNLDVGRNILQASLFIICAKCIKIGPKRELQRCSRCLTMYYCSRTCQSADWYSGHRLACNKLLLRGKEFAHISGRNRSFLRALAYYTTRQEEATQKRLLFVEQHPDQLSCGGLDFTAGECAIEIGGLDEVTPDFELEAARITRSGGQLQLYLMRVLDAHQTRRLTWPFALPVSSAELLPRSKVLQNRGAPGPEETAG